jgi:uncharacterized paraquat-inducible protein A
MDPNFIQKRMQEMQKSGEFKSVLSKVASTRNSASPRSSISGSSVDKKQNVITCKNCNRLLESTARVCSRCGTRVEMPSRRF